MNDFPFTYISSAASGLVKVFEDGHSEVKSVGSSKWRRWRTKKAEVPLADWQRGKLEYKSKLERECPWRLVKRDYLPSIRKLEAWQMDGVCETVKGDTVEPDGTGPDGTPSWLLALGMI